MSGRRARVSVKVLFVCMGNTCRSAMAEAIFRALARARPALAGFVVGSAGTSARSGDRASAEAVAVLRERGIALSGHRARPLTPELLGDADVILAMSRTHLDGLGAFVRPGATATTLGRFAGAGEEIADPIGGGREDYEETARQLTRLLETAIEKLAAGKTR